MGQKCPYFFKISRGLNEKLLIASLCLLCAAASASEIEPPFLNKGKGSFDFGVVPANYVRYELNINKDNHTVLRQIECYSAHCSSAVVLYQGPFKPLIELKDGDYIQLGFRQARLLDKDKKLKFGCDSLNNPYDAELEPCISEYYDND